MFRVKKQCLCYKIETTSLVSKASMLKSGVGFTAASFIDKNCRKT